MSVYVGSIPSVKEMLQASITAYNQKKATLYDSLFNDSTHTEQWKADEKQKRQLALQAEYAANLVDIQNRLAAAAEGTRAKIGGIRFPLTTSSLPENRTAGEVQQNGAQLFLMRDPSQESILASIRNAFTNGRVDYAFALIEGARDVLKPDSITGLFSSDSEAFLEKLAAIERGFDATGNLGTLQSELALVPGVTENARHFGLFLSNENLTGPFIPLEAAREMTVDEVAKNLESINWMMQFSNTGD